MRASHSSAYMLGDAPRGIRRLRPTRAHQQVTLLLALYLTVGIALALVVNTRLTEIGADADRANRVYPILQKFETWERAQVALGDGLLSVASEPFDERSAYIGTAGEKFNATTALWSAYRQDLLHTREESRLTREYQTTSDKATELGIVVISAPEVSADMIAQFEAANVAQLNAINALHEYYADRASGAARASAAGTRDLQQLHTLGVVAAVLGLGAIGALIVRLLRKRDKGSIARAYRTEIETRLQRALEMIHSEEKAFTVVESALHVAAPQLPTELLIADSSRAHFHRVVAPEDDATSGCPVSVPGECPASARGQTQTFHSSSDLDACPYLVGRPSGPCSAVCIPLSIAGNTVGVIHGVGVDGSVPKPEVVANLEIVARKTGERIGMLRAFTRSETQAQTDSLTGLLNRRSLEERVHDIQASDDGYTVAYADLDHFKMLNDVHGHDAGDRALRLFARVLRDSVRPQDLPARYGGEEFVVVLPKCDGSDAGIVAARIRDRLADTLQSAGMPSFTVSIGLASSDAGLSFAEVLEQADRALLTAKRSGRNRTVLAGSFDPLESAVRPSLTTVPDVGARHERDE